ncbi:MAG TPA: serine/threonine-protein kinase [Vicinamibacterales bacterium]
MGTVYRARDEVLHRDVALKVVGAVVSSPGLDERLLEEARTLARLEHPGVVPVHDGGMLADGRAFYVMKLVKGTGLQAHFGSLTRLDERLRLFERLCEPLAFAHAHGIVHRDLKPANVMVGGFGEVLVLDWGLSAQAGSTAGSERAGTPGFMPPEQQTGGPADPRADVYALGALLAGMLTGDDPAGIADLDGALSRAHVAAPLRAICSKAMAASPDDRYADAGELADDVARWRAGLPVRAYREGPLERLGRLYARHRVPILLVAAYLVMRALVAWYTARG